MPNLLHLVIRPPFDRWKYRYGYGDTLPSDGHPSWHLHFETTEPDANVYAVCTGKLSTRFPGQPIPDVRSELEFIEGYDVDTVSLYLEPVFVNLRPDFRARLQGLKASPAVVDPGTIASLLDGGQIDVLHGFVYLNLDANSLRENIEELLHLSILGSATTGAELEQLWLNFLAGELDIWVEGGMPLGKPDNAYLETNEPDARQVGFTVLTSDGPHDPSHFFDWMRDFVEEGLQVEEFLQLAPQKWPLIDPTLTPEAAVTTTETNLFPYSVLQQLRPKLTPKQWRAVGNNQKSLYRQRLLERVGHANTPGEVPPFEFNDWDWRNPFQLEAIVEFYANFDDPWKKYTVPLDPSDSNYQTIDFLPLTGSKATVTGQTVNLNAQIDAVDLNAQISFERIFERIWAGRDYIYLDQDTARDAKRYRILAVDAASQTLTVDGEPEVNGETPWHMFHRPTLVLIDPIGGRLYGGKAKVTTDAFQVKIEDVPQQKKYHDKFIDQVGKINKNFDTVYFHNDKSVLRAYRITNVKIAADSFTLTLDNTPDFDGGESTWQIPSGVGGIKPIQGARPPKELYPEFKYRAGGNKDDGWDHYDGYLFVVQNGKIHDRRHWSSFTSHNPIGAANKKQGRSSIRGNRRYYFSSFISPDRRFQNFSFAVVDSNAYLTGSSASLQSSPDGKTRIILDGTPDLKFVTGEEPIILYSDLWRRFQAYEITSVDKTNYAVTINEAPEIDGPTTSWRIRQYDGVREARFYYEESVSEDRAHDDEQPGTGGRGKKVIRIHRGNGNVSTWSGSHGCQVSPLMGNLRDQLIRLYRNYDEYEYDFTLSNIYDKYDFTLSDIYRATYLKAETLWKKMGRSNRKKVNAGWKDLIVGEYWVIRPDERPLDS